MRLSVMPEGKKLGWNFVAFNGIATISDKNGNKVTGTIINIDDIRYAKLSSKFGDLTVGYNGVYGQWAFEEAGGSVVVFWAKNPSGEIWLAGGYEKRLLINEGEFLLTPPGGFGINSESEEDTARRETLEETGVHIDTMVEVGCTTHNRAFWVKQQDGKWPLTVFAVEVEWNSLKEKVGQRFIPSTENATADIDKLSKLVFLPAMDAISDTTDDIAVVAYAKTVAAISKGKI